MFCRMAVRSSASMILVRHNRCGEWVICALGDGGGETCGWQKTHFLVPFSTFSLSKKLESAVAWKSTIAWPKPRTSNLWLLVVASDS
jgi:hypothetical protein